jgi:peptidoglycan/LPS O-acetylase OafA/YrhL
MFLILGAIHTPRLFGGLPSRFLSWKGFYPIAQLSYSIYLVHEMIFLRLFPRLAPLLAPRLGAWGAMTAAAALGLAVVFGLAAILYVLIERPSMRLRSHPAVTALIDFLRGKRLQPELEDA